MESSKRRMVGAMGKWPAGPVNSMSRIVLGPVEAAGRRLPVCGEWLDVVPKPWTLDFSRAF